MLDIMLQHKFDNTDFSDSRVVQQVCFFDVFKRQIQVYQLCHGDQVVT